MPLLCAACSTPPLDLPMEVPGAFEQSTGPAATGGPALDWYRKFSSQELNDLVRLAQNNNIDVVAAEARIRQADARARAAGAGILPQVDIGPNLSRFAGRSNGISARETDWSLLASASYEVDFWGKNRASANSARLTAIATRADLHTMMLTTTAGVADSYFQVLSLRERLSLARANLESTREVLAVIDARFKAGAASAAELATQRAAVASAELAIPPLDQQEIEARGALAVLVGRAPEAFTIDAQQLDHLSEPIVTPGLPSELLARRPDVLAAEANLQAAHADLHAARAALFPSLTLTVSGGIQNPAVQAAVTTLVGAGPALTVGASLVQTIFDGGRRRAVRDEAEGKQAELLASYHGAILNALLDVERALAALAHLNAQQPAQRENVQQSELAYAASRLRYKAGSGDYLSVLEAQRTLYAARQQMSEFRLARLQAVVALYKALGGGWSEEAK